MCRHGGGVLHVIVLQDRLRLLGIAPGDLKLLFTLLDEAGNGQIQIDKFFRCWPARSFSCKRLHPWDCEGLCGSIVDFGMRKETCRNQS